MKRLIRHVLKQIKLSQSTKYYT